MEKHSDIDGNILEEGLYRSKRSGQFLYFTGKYNKYEEASFNDIDGRTVDLPIYCSALLKKLSKREIEKKIKWLEKGLED